MSSFPKRQPELFFNTKNLYSGGGTSQGSGSNLAAAGLAMMADKPLAAEDIDSVPDSWVELAPSRASLSSSIEAVNVESTSGGDASVNKDSRLSPVSLQSPHVEFESSLEQVKYRLVKDMLPIEAAKSTDWLWDWTNRSDAAVNTSENATRNRSGGQIGSTLTTPPNSPEPESSEFDFKSSMKSATAKLHQKKQQAQQKSAFHWSSLCRWDVFLAIVFTNIVTGAVVYYYLTRVQKSDDPFVEQAIITKYYW